MPLVASLFLRVSILLAFSLWTAAAVRNGRPHVNVVPRPTVPKVELSRAGPVTSRNGTVLPAYNTTFEFDQLIDHTNPSLGTFKQRFWHTSEFYELGGPIILFTPGEANAFDFTGYLTNETINGQISQQQNGSTIVLEHRFFGLSNPFPNLSVQSFKVHNLQQAVDDLAYFAQNVNLPNMPAGAKTSPDQAPWILIGGSYSGALVSWTMVNKPGIFWAGYASSAVVETIADFWQYFDPIRQFMPQNCSADVQVTMAHIDEVFSGNNQSAINSIKDLFGLGGLSHTLDVVGSIRSNIFDWQSLQPETGPDGLFFEFCDALEVKNGVNAPVTGWGLDHALNAWGNFWTSEYLSLLCGDTDVETCLGTFNASEPFWTDTTIDNADRSWEWIVCNEVGWYQESAPSGTPSLVSRLLQPSYDERQCTNFFPEAFPSNTIPVPTTSATNSKFGGWNVNIDRLFFANGKRDPWRDATVSSDFHTRQSTSTQPIAEGDGFHTSDLLTANGVVDATVLAVQKQALATFRTWVSQWKAPSTAPARNPTAVAAVAAPAPGAPKSGGKQLQNAWFKSFGSVTV